MKIKLIESAKPYDKYKNKFEKNIVPVLKDLGYEVNLNRTVSPNKYTIKYFGTYADGTGRTTPFNIDVNTTHQGIDSSRDNLFMTINVDGKFIEVGGFNVNDVEDFVEIFDASMEDRTISNTFAKLKGTILAANGKEAKTKDEWIETFKKNQKEMEPRAFGAWVNTVFPVEVYENISLATPEKKN